MIVPRLYEDPSVLHQNTMPDRAYYVPSSSRNDMLVRHRECSDRLQILSGCDWLFAWYPGIQDLQDLFYLQIEQILQILYAWIPGEEPVTAA